MPSSAPLPTDSPTSPLVAALEAARTRATALDALAGAVLVPAPGEPPDAWNQRRRGGQDFYADIPLADRRALEAWALGHMERWVQIFDRAELGAPERQAVWGDPHVIPAFYIARRAITRALGDTTEEADDTVLFLKRAHDYLRSTLVDLVFNSWHRHGTLDADGIQDILTEWEAGSEAPNIREWVALMGQPALTVTDMVQAFEATASDVIQTALLDRAGLVSHPDLRAVLWRFAGSLSLVQMMVPQMPAPEFAVRFAETLAMDDTIGYDILGTMLSAAGPEQTSGLRLTQEQMVCLSTKLHPEHRASLLPLMGQVRRAGSRRPKR